MKITVHVKTKSRIESITQFGDLKNHYIVRVNAPPIDGKANERVIELLSVFFQCSKSCIIILSGHKAKIKIFQINF